MREQRADILWVKYDDNVLEAGQHEAEDVAVVVAIFAPSGGGVPEKARIGQQAQIAQGAALGRCGNGRVGLGRVSVRCVESVTA